MVRFALFTKYVQIFAVVALYWIVSILTVFVNKNLLSGESVKLEAPLFIVWFQCLISVLICLFIKYLSRTLEKNWFPKSSPIDWESFKKIIPLTLLFVSMIVFNTLCLKYVGVSFYYVGRSLTTVFNVVFTYFLLSEKIGFKVCVCCTVITCGFLLGIDQEGASGTLSILGSIYGVGASLTLALYSIYTKKVLPHVDNQIWLISFYNNFYSCWILGILILFSHEFSTILEYPKLFDVTFWSAMVLGGVCGFSIGYVSSLQIKVTSALTHNISGTAKAAAQTVIATFYYDESKTILWWISNAVVLGGSAAYTAARQMEMKQKMEHPSNSKV